MMYTCSYCDERFKELDDCLKHEKEHENCNDPWGMCIYDDEYTHKGDEHWLDDEYSHH